MTKFRSIFALTGLSLLLTACHVGEAEIPSAQTDRVQVEAIFKDLDDRTLSVSEQLENYTDNAVILAPDQREIRGTEALRQHLSEFGNGVQIDTTHEIVELTSLSEMVVVQGRVVGTAQPDGDPNIYSFETKNIILFERGDDNGLKVWKVIYNSAPVSDTVTGSDTE